MRVAQKIARRYPVMSKTLLFWIWLLLVSVVCLTIITYVAGFWTIELTYVGSLQNIPTVVIKGRVPPYLKNDQKSNLVDLMKQLPDINIDDATKVPKPSCQELIAWNKTAIKLALIYQQGHPHIKISDMTYPALTGSCEKFIITGEYVTKPVSLEERDFPIAFSIVMFEDVEQFERLLRAIYRPQNYYCIHIDRKSPQAVHHGVHSIVKCFDNVFIASKLVDVVWGTYSVLQAELRCMRDLWKHKSWKYFINLTGKEFPLQTNLDIVKILKAFNGANNMEATVLRRNKERTTFIQNNTHSTNIAKSAPPIPVTLVKGSVHISASRAFVDYVLHDARALAFLDWVKDTSVPDETYFSSLNHSPHLEVPGAYKGVPETDPKTYPFLTRFKNWGSWPFDYPCYGLRLRRICIFGVGDLKLLTERPEMFANKFQLNFQPMAYECMEEWINNRTIEDKMGQQDFDFTLYNGYEFVKNHV